jgi:hypothetical protein
MTRVLLDGYVHTCRYCPDRAIARACIPAICIAGQRGDWLARRVGWLVYTTLGYLAPKRQGYENIQDVLAWVLPL